MAFGDADASTPAFTQVNTNWTTIGATSGLFTPPADSLVRLAVFSDTSSGANPGNETVTDTIDGTTGWTFKIRRAKPDSGSQAGCVVLWEKYYAVSPVAPIAVTVVGNATGAASGGFSTKVVAGCTGTAGHVEGSNTAAVMSIVQTTVNAGVRVEMAGTDWNVQAAPTAGASQTAVLSSQVGAGPDTRVYVGVQNAVTTTAGTAVTMSTASPSSGNANNFIAWELVPSAGGATSLNAGNAAVTAAANNATLAAALPAGTGGAAVALAASNVTLQAKPQAGSGAVAVGANAATLLAKPPAGNAVVAVGAFDASLTSGNTLNAGGAAASVAANSVTLALSAGAGNAVVTVGAFGAGLLARPAAGFAAVTLGAFDVTLTSTGPSLLTAGPAAVGVGAFDVTLSTAGGGGSTMTGSWYGLLDVFNEIHANAEEQRARVRTACWVDGEPLESTRDGLHCKYCGRLYSASGNV